MIDKHKDLKKIALTDGKYYDSKDIRNITEKKDTIELETNRENIIIPKTAITRIEYYIGAAANVKQYR